MAIIKSVLSEKFKIPHLVYLSGFRLKNRDLEIDLVVSPNKDGSVQTNCESTLLFTSICNLSFKFAGDELTQISGFDILDLSNDGLENINYKILDYKDGKINFYCKDVKSIPNI
ncbi:hypothetical protein BDD43_5531 [Mucilaginibacter gracilis]|uniref:Immunity protein 50 of polymorphic toxin system n=1 Tax=Mucilaginibacter gracilis TaxID=423350 RepID=A0A495J8Q4_9SPHI|nr:hypothetical protein [Mucilaginibacter gracilis]RKR85267.1 hypothetical protein BDD43_5531 [Mucilaginibacter gracilis]